MTYNDFLVHFTNKTLGDCICQNNFSHFNIAITINEQCLLDALIHWEKRMPRDNWGKNESHVKSALYRSSRLIVQCYIDAPVYMYIKIFFKCVSYSTGMLIVIVNKGHCIVITSSSFCLMLCVLFIFFACLFVVCCFFLQKLLFS